MLQTGQVFGKYRIDALVAEGGFARVYKAYDTIEGIHVALKIPLASSTPHATLDDFRKEIRLTAQLDHPNILPIKNASLIEGRLVIAYPLGDSTLAERITKRMAVRTSVDYAEQMLAAVSFAHKKKIIHCDIKPENFILFPQNRLRLGDFGIARIGMRTMQASGSGTVGYISPEQALGKPSARSDVFSLGLILYRMFTGYLPEWPFEWPSPGYERLQEKSPPPFHQFLRRALELSPQKRFTDAIHMEQAFRRLRPQLLGHHTKKKKRRQKTEPRRPDWREQRFRQFRREYGALLKTKEACAACGGPVSETMQYCPWCRHERSQHTGDVSFPAHCPHCNRGMKLDWRFCPWCYSSGVEPHGERHYTDVRYSARCTSCREPLMPFMRYCPWCHRKVRRKWTSPEMDARCPSCGWGVLKAFWDYCPWCGKSLKT